MVGLAVLLALFGWAWRSGGNDGLKTTWATPAAGQTTIAALLAHPQRYQQGSITLTGRVDEFLDNQAARLSSETGDNPLLVIFETPQPRLETGLELTVEGRLRPASTVPPNRLGPSARMELDRQKFVFIVADPADVMVADPTD
ncbi:MAG: hypothetical protein AB7S38_19150 [Vulcanimicrobiota bacterium]